MKFKIVEWTAKRIGSLYGFASVVFDDYLRVDQIAIRDGKRGLWAGLPSRQWIDKSGKAHYDPIISFADKDASFRFSDALVDKLAQLYPNDVTRAPAEHEQSYPPNTTGRSPEDYLSA